MEQIPQLKTTLDKLGGPTWREVKPTEQDSLVWFSFPKDKRSEKAADTSLHIHDRYHQ